MKTKCGIMFCTIKKLPSIFDVLFHNSSQTSFFLVEFGEISQLGTFQEANLGNLAGCGFLLI